MTHVPRGHRQPAQRPRFEEPYQLDQHFLYPVGLHPHQVVRGVRDARVLLLDLGRFADVGLAHLQEPAAGRQQPQ